MADFKKVGEMEYIGNDADTRPTSVPYGCRAYVYDVKKWEITPDGGATWGDFIEPGGSIIKVSLADEATYSLPDESSGFAVVKLGGSNNYRAKFDWDEDGNIVMLESGGDAYVKPTDTNGYLCIYTVTKQIIIKNRTGNDGTLKLLRMV